MMVLQDCPPALSVSPKVEMETHSLSLESTLKDLLLWNFQVETIQLGREVAQLLEANPLLPGIILTEQGEFIGMISRRRFLEQMSRPYGLDLFLRRPSGVLDRLANVSTQLLMFTGDKLIVEAARQSLQRSPEFLYEPLVVQLTSAEYRLLDVHQLLLAQSHIHELTTQLLREQTQAQLIQTEKMASLGQMVAGVAHEIRNPVNGLWGNLNFLSNYIRDLMNLVSAYDREFGNKSERISTVKEEIEFDFLIEDLPEILASMRVSAEQLNKLVGGLRNFSHMSEAKPKPADLHECIDSTLLILRNRIKQGIKVHKNYGNLPEIQCYSGQLSQVFMNLITNAIDAMMERKATEFWKPTLEIRTEVVEISGASWASICIADNGCGIPPAIQSKIFETFFTTKPVGKGTGLGLAISHQIVTQKHRGELKLQSQPGSGTEFEILLPME